MLQLVVVGHSVFCSWTIGSLFLYGKYYGNTMYRYNTMYGNTLYGNTLYGNSLYGNTII